MGSLALGLILLAVLGSVASAKPKVAVLGLEVIGSLDPEQVKLAKQLTGTLRERAGAGTSPYELAPNTDKELVDEKVMNNCGTEALVCMAPIGLNMRADYLMYGKIEKVDKGYHVTVKLLRVSTKMPLPTFSELVSVTDMKNDPKGVARRVFARITATDEGIVTVRVSNAERTIVYVDDKPMGTTTGGVLTISVPAGKHRLAVAPSERGWKRHEEELAINAGDQRNIPVALAREGQEPVKPADPGPQPGAGALPAGPSHETPGGVASSGGSGAWAGVAIGSAVLTVAAIGGFALSWYELTQIGKVDGDNRSWPFAYSCTPDQKAKCDDGALYEKVSYATGIGAAVLGGFTVYAFYKGASKKERPVASRRTARSNRTLTVTPVLSARSGGATLRFDW